MNDPAIRRHNPRQQLLFTLKVIFFLTGSITVSGSAGVGSNSGGGSGGSILIRTRALEGSGVITVNGGAGNGDGGGGGGGRMAVYWQDREWWYGALTAFGGSSSRGGNGGAGTVYLEVSLCLEKMENYLYDQGCFSVNRPFLCLLLPAFVTSSGAPFSKAPVVAGSKKLSFVCRVCIQNLDINSFEIQTIIIPGNKREWTGFSAKTRSTFPLI